MAPLLREYKDPRPDYEVYVLKLDAYAKVAHEKEREYIREGGFDRE